MAIVFYPLKIYSYIINFVKTEDTLLIFAFLGVISLILIFVGWSLVKNLDVIKVESVSIDKNRDQKPFPGNYIQFIIHNIKGIICTILLVLLSDYFLDFVSFDFSDLIFFIVGILIYNTMKFLSDKRKIRRLNDE